MSEAPKKEDKLIEELTETYKSLFLIAEGTMALVLPSMLENTLRKMILSKMRADLSGNSKDGLFEGYGPIASFSARIDLCYALELIDEDDRRDLRAIKDIRNQFAHSSTPRHFNDAQMEVAFKKFKDFEAGQDNKVVFGTKIARLFTKFRNYLPFGDDPRWPEMITMLNALKSWPKT